jgi:hypothetical protein
LTRIAQHCAAHSPSELGFEKREVRMALEALRRRREKPELEMSLRGALALLVK